MTWLKFILLGFGHGFVSADTTEPRRGWQLEMQVNSIVRRIDYWQRTYQPSYWRAKSVEGR
jgi:hypothetical protein